MDFGAKFAVGLSYHDFLEKHGTEEQRRKWANVHAAIKLTPAQQTLLAGFVREMKVLCLAGAWCGDCIEQCPIFDHFAAASNGKIQLRFFDRDAHADLAAELPICGGARVPVTLFLSEDGQQISRYGDRTLSKYRQVAADNLGAACPTGLFVPGASLLESVIQDWLNEFERVHLILRTSARLRKLHND